MRSYRCLALVTAGSLAFAGLAFAGASAPAVGADGSWQVVPSPGGRNAFLASVTFSSAGDGWAVGSTGKSLTHDGIDPLIVHWTGDGWQSVAGSPVPFSDEVLTGVSSAGPSDAWAVGWQDPYGTGPVHALLMHWNGQRWSVAQGPAGAGIVNAIDARASDDVWAVGHGLFEHFDGSSWSVADSPRSDVNLTAVTDIAPDDVWAVGTKPARGSGYQSSVPYVAHWDGRGWSSVAVPHPAGQAGLASVSAKGPNDVWAVGSKGSSPSSPYVLHYDGTAWHQVRAPAAGGSQLSGVVVVSSKDVWAVGNRDDRLHNGFAVWRTLTEHWDGSAWAIVPSRNDSRHDNFLTATAASTGRLWAVGGDRGTLVERH